VLGWGRTYILALVSERIGADLRTTTYEHLLKLSQEYFGGKRTGDLMARIGSETDRINIFISLHLLDFATDVLMIVMTTASWCRSTPGWQRSPCCRCRSSAG
jgi:ATP-binding cassette subfamily B protein